MIHTNDFTSEQLLLVVDISHLTALYRSLLCICLILMRSNPIDHRSNRIYQSIIHFKRNAPNVILFT